LEKQIIIDYHLRGEQQELFEENPRLEKVAKKLLGYEDFYAFVSQSGPVSKEDPKYKRLLELAQKLNVKIEKEIEKYQGKKEEQIQEATEKLKEVVEGGAHRQENSDSK